MEVLATRFGDRFAVNRPGFLGGSNI